MATDQNERMEERIRQRNEATKARFDELRKEDKKPETTESEKFFDAEFKKDFGKSIKSGLLCVVAVAPVITAMLVLTKIFGTKAA